MNEDRERMKAIPVLYRPVSRDASSVIEQIQVLPQEK